MKLKYLAALITVLLLLVMPAILHAQGPDPGGDPDAVPIDGGLSILLAAGVGYVAKKGYDARKRVSRK